MRRSVASELDFTPLVGCLLSSVLIAAHHVELNLVRPSRDEAQDPGGRIDIEAGFILSQPNTNRIVSTNDTLRQCASSLIPLIGEPVQSVTREENSSLTLAFANGACLMLVVDDRGFESYHVHLANASLNI
jgi:hypothetical protein